MIDILNNQFSKESVSKSELEQVEKKKHEYKLVGKYLRRKGLKLYAYNSMRDKLKEVQINAKDSVNLIPDENEKLVPVDLGIEEAEVDTRNIHFEALNLNNAKKRIRRYKEGKIKELCNLRKVNPDGISFLL